MMPELKAGSRLKSTVCNTEVIVVKAPAGDLKVTCGGAPMVLAAEPITEKGTVSSDAAGGTALGKRYVNADETLEILCTKAGEGSLGVGGEQLSLKEAKPLPASD
ncbi:MAG TPA: hypothetical protein VGQ20_08245 [Acidimicrobiales bacterium]|jgi:hypothetical protein|nr:hypothetical protein [Acidimicrobiales bacterium]